MSETGMRDIEALIQEKIQAEQVQGVELVTNPGAIEDVVPSDNEDIFSEVEKEFNADREGVEFDGGNDDTLAENEEGHKHNEDKSEPEMELEEHEEAAVNDGEHVDTESTLQVAQDGVRRPRVRVVHPATQDRITNLVKDSALKFLKMFPIEI